MSMIIGYSGEGTNDRCTMEALKDKWCPGADFIPSHRRGSSGGRRKYEIENACVELNEKGASLAVFFTDANNRSFRKVKREESKWIPDEYKHKSIYAVADRNIECWLVADKEHAKKVMKLTGRQLTGDPKKHVDRYFGSWRDPEKEERIKNFVKSSNLKKWVKNSDSFEDFYEDCRKYAKRTKCKKFPNLKEKGR